MARTNPYEAPRSESEGRGPGFRVDIEGVNLDLRDNLFQAMGVVCGLLAGALLGGWLVFTWRGVALGGFLGVMAGLVVTGLLLMPVENSKARSKQRS